MKVAVSAAVVALMVSKASCFSNSPWSTKVNPTFTLRMSSYDDQLRAYYDQPTPVHSKDNGDVNGNANDDVNGKANGDATPTTVETRVVQVPVQVPVLPPPPQPQSTAMTMPPPPPPQAEVRATKPSPVLGAGAVAFLGLPVWLLASAQIFFGGNSGTMAPPAPGTMTLPSSMVTATKESAANPAGVVVLSQPITKAEVRDLFGLWNDALQTGDPAVVASRYAKDGVLLPTLSDIPRTDFEGIKDYFVHFLEKKPVGKILEGDIYVGNNWAQDAGIYEFTFADGSAVKARYSFIYSFEDGKWMISHHHSSLMPQEVVKPTKITESEVRGLFDLWNDALATGDPRQVAARYSKDAVLLPTLSDKARYTTDEIADYFVHFLEKKPTGKILEGNVKIGPNWAQDAGIYEFTFENGSQTRGRYSYVYTFENGEWKISNHHSSIMPEPAVAAIKKAAEIESASSAE